ncbi:hypothetical protein DIPPA_31413 [Diplonema papillatum]|nr:hypothetical protein DIPPA_31413 [Diplonema papillatum]
MRGTRRRGPAGDTGGGRGAQQRLVGGFKRKRESGYDAELRARTAQRGVEQYLDEVLCGLAAGDPPCVLDALQKLERVRPDALATCSSGGELFSRLVALLQDSPGPRTDCDPVCNPHPAAPDADPEEIADHAVFCLRHLLCCTPARQSPWPAPQSLLRKLMLWGWLEAHGPSPGGGLDTAIFEILSRFAGAVDLNLLECPGAAGPPGCPEVLAYLLSLAGEAVLAPACKFVAGVALAHPRRFCGVGFAAPPPGPLRDLRFPHRLSVSLKLAAGAGDQEHGLALVNLLLSLQNESLAVCLCRFGLVTDLQALLHAASTDPSVSLQQPKRAHSRQLLASVVHTMAWVSGLREARFFFEPYLANLTFVLASLPVLDNLAAITESSDIFLSNMYGLRE